MVPAQARDRGPGMTLVPRSQCPSRSLIVNVPTDPGSRASWDMGRRGTDSTEATRRPRDLATHSPIQQGCKGYSGPMWQGPEVPRNHRDKSTIGSG
jgi:hypothetical protein